MAIEAKPDLAFADQAVPLWDILERGN